MSTVGVAGIAVAGILAVTMSPVLGPHPADAYGSRDRFTYARDQPNLCRNIANTVHVHPTPFRIAVSAVRGTNDFVADRNGYSLRTCDWKVRSGAVFYRCSPPAGRARWKIAITGAGERGSKTRNRVTSTMSCDNRWYRVTYKWPAKLNTHVHLWAPTESSVLRRVQVSIP